MPDALPAAPALALHGVSRRYRRGFLLRAHDALREVDLELASGERLGLLGPNGSGKTTLLRIAAGIERPTAGTVRVHGLSPERPAAARRLGYLPEGSPFPRELTARGALNLLGSLQGMSRSARRERGAELLERVGLRAERDERLSRFSRGMLRRFGLAQAFLHEPDVVLLDEPTAGLDAPGFAVLDELLGEAHARGATTILCSHWLGDVQRHCDALVVMCAGRIAHRAPPSALDDAGVLALYKRLAGEPA